MGLNNDIFEQSIRQQILLNQARTPTERMNALCDLLDVARAMAPSGPEAQERRRRVLMARQREREQLHAFCRQCLTTSQSDASSGV